MKRFTLLLFLSSLLNIGVAQDVFNRFLTFSWDINAPLSNTDYIKKISFKGYHIGYSEKISDNFWMGVSFNNAVYGDHAPRQTYYLDGAALTTDFYKYVVTYSATLNGYYFFTPDKRLSPFAGLGLGANYDSYKLYYNVYSASNSNWGLIIRPEAGVILKIGKEMFWGLAGALHYDYSTVKYDDAGYSNFTNIGFRVGIVMGIGRGSPF